MENQGRLTRFFGSVASLNKFSTVMSTVVIPSFGSPFVVACDPLSLFEIVAKAARASAFRPSSSRFALVSFVSVRLLPIALRYGQNT